jgi:hypothetical protein
LEEEEGLDETLLALGILVGLTLEVLLVEDGEAKSLGHVDGLDVILEGSTSGGSVILEFVKRFTGGELLSLEVALGEDHYAITHLGLLVVVSTSGLVSRLGVTVMVAEESQHIHWRYLSASCR